MMYQGEVKAPLVYNLGRLLKAKFEYDFIWYKAGNVFIQLAYAFSSLRDEAWKGLFSQC